jgi:hypothetical protein
MIVDFIGALFFFVLGVCVGRETLAHQFLKPRTERYMTSDEDYPVIYGKSKLEWFWLRENEGSPERARLSLREYAKTMSGHSS